MPRYGDQLSMETDEDGYLNIRYLPREEKPTEEEDPEDNYPEEEVYVPQETDEDFTVMESEVEPENELDENNPFAETDLPVTLLSEESEENT